MLKELYNPNGAGVPLHDECEIGGLVLAQLLSGSLTPAEIVQNTQKLTSDTSRLGDFNAESMPEFIRPGHKICNTICALMDSGVITESSDGKKVYLTPQQKKDFFYSVGITD